MRSRLVVLSVLGTREQTRAAYAAWTGLSRSCHRHAYELPPGESEVRAHLDHVRTLFPAAADPLV